MLPLYWGYLLFFPQISQFNAAAVHHRSSYTRCSGRIAILLETAMCLVRGSSRLIIK